MLTLLQTRRTTKETTGLTARRSSTPGKPLTDPARRGTINATETARSEETETMVSVVLAEDVEVVVVEVSVN